MKLVAWIWKGGRVDEGLSVEQGERGLDGGMGCVLLNVFVHLDEFLRGEFMQVKNLPRGHFISTFSLTFFFQGASLIGVVKWEK